MTRWTCVVISSLDVTVRGGQIVRAFTAGCLSLLLAFVPFAQSSCATEPLSPEVATIIAPVVAAYETIDRELAALPPPATVAEELLRLRRLDQEPRQAYAAIDFAALPPDLGKAAFDAAWAVVNPRDAANIARLKSLMPAEGWFTKSQVGEEAAQSAWLIVQHAINTEPQLMNVVLARMERLLASGDTNTQDYALLFDRVAMHEGRRQRYGTQMVCRDNKWTVYPIERDGDVEARRREMGIKSTTAEQIAAMAARGCAREFSGPWPE